MSDTTQSTAIPWLTPRTSSELAPPIAIGTMNFGKRASRVESERIVHRAVERGLVFFDTANVYNAGESEKILGKALGGKRERCFIASKVGLWGLPKNEGLAPKVIAKAIDDSLARLGTEYLDVYYLHAPDPKTPIEATVDAIHALIDTGKIRSWGVSNYASWQILEIDQLCDARKMARPALSQVIYNVLVRQIEVEYLRFASRHPIHTTTYNPLAGGLLTGKHSRAEIPKGSRFDDNKMYQRRYWTERLFEQVDAIAGVAREEGMSLTALSYAWVAGRPGVDSILVGPADVSQLDEAIEGCAKKLSSTARTRLDDLHYAFAGTDAVYARS